MRSVQWDDIFYVVEELDKRKNKIYRLRFKTDGTDIRKGYMSTIKWNAQGEGVRWLYQNKNHKLVLDMVFELEVLND